jgi:hypothetical protein
MCGSWKIIIADKVYVEALYTQIGKGALDLQSLTMSWKKSVWTWIVSLHNAWSCNKSELQLQLIY